MWDSNHHGTDAGMDAVPAADGNAGTSSVVGTHMGTDIPAGPELSWASGTSFDSHSHPSLQVPGAMLEAFGTFALACGSQIVEVRCSRIVEVRCSFALVTKPEYFRRNHFRHLGATMKTPQLRGFFVLSCIQAEVRKEKPTETWNFRLCLQNTSDDSDHQTLLSVCSNNQLK